MHRILFSDQIKGEEEKKMVKKNSAKSVVDRNSLSFISIIGSAEGDRFAQAWSGNSPWIPRSSRSSLREEKRRYLFREERSD